MDFGGHMMKPRQWARKAIACFISLFLAASFHNIIAGWVYAQPVSFVTAKEFSAGSGPVASRVGDFNQDGNQDLAVANRFSNNVSVLLGNGDGTFQMAVNFPVGGSPNSLVVGYFNGDSIQDFAVANSTPNPSISVLLGNGNGTFQPASNFPAGASTRSIDAGDFNGDHILDLIVATGGGVAVHLGNGNGTFRAPLITPGAGNFVIGYFNDDGILDVAYTDLFGVMVRTGNGDGTFRSPIPSPGVTGSLVVGYFNRDDIADLAVAHFAETVPQPTVEILLGNGDGTFRSGGSFSGAFVANELVVDDFNGDNIADLANLYSGNVFVALGRGDGTFHVLGVSFPVRRGVSIVVGEFNGDGRKDLAVTGDGAVSVALGYGDGTFQVTWNYELGAGLPSLVGSSTVALGEFNGDVIPDLAIAIASLPRRISILLGNGDGSFRWAFDFPTGSDESNPECLAVGEFNRDGIQDLVIASRGCVGILLGNRNGTFQPAVNFPGVDNPSSITLGYFNGDAFQDLAVVPFGASGISVLLGNGEGTFQAPLFFDTGVPLFFAAE
jgi:large repetitive protein